MATYHDTIYLGRYLGFGSLAKGEPGALIDRRTSTLVRIHFDFTRTGSINWCGRIFILGAGHLQLLLVPDTLGCIVEVSSVTFCLGIPSLIIWAVLHI